MSLKQMLEALQAVVGELPPISYGPARSGDIRHSRANNARLLERFKLPQQTPMSVGLAWHRERAFSPAMQAVRNYFHDAFLAPQQLSARR